MFYFTFLPCRHGCSFMQWRMFITQRSSRGGFVRGWVQAIEQEHFSLEILERGLFIVLMQMMNSFLMLYMTVILCCRICNLTLKAQYNSFWCRRAKFTMVEHRSLQVDVTYLVLNIFLHYILVRCGKEMSISIVGRNTMSNMHIYYFIRRNISRHF